MSVNLKQKRERSENWSAEEKAFLVKCVRERKNFIETKSTCPRALKAKKHAWIAITKMFAAKGFMRSENRIREQWRRMKCGSKDKLTHYLKKSQIPGHCSSSTESARIPWTIRDVSSINSMTENDIFDLTIAAECHNLSNEDLDNDVEGRNLLSSEDVDDPSKVVLIENDGLPDDSKEMFPEERDIHSSEHRDSSTEDANSIGHREASLLDERILEPIMVLNEATGCFEPQTEETNDPLSFFAPSPHQEHYPSPWDMYGDPRYKKKEDEAKNEENSHSDLTPYERELLKLQDMKFWTDCQHEEAIFREMMRNIFFQRKNRERKNLMEENVLKLQEEVLKLQKEKELLKIQLVRRKISLHET